MLATFGLTGGDFMTGFPDGQPQTPPKLMEPMRAVLCLEHYAIRTERADCEWVRRYVKFHGNFRLAGCKSA
jgi:hypothetical protein